MKLDDFTGGKFTGGEGGDNALVLGQRLKQQPNHIKKMKKKKKGSKTVKSMK